VSGGLCQAHIDEVDDTRQAQAAAMIPPPQAIRWTPQDVKATFGAIANGGRDDSGGQYVGGNVDALHVHLYNDNGAHVKVGGDKYRFLQKPDYRFDLALWNEGVAAVKALGDEATIKKLLGAMSIVLAKYGGQSDAEFAARMEALGYDRVAAR
jgi:hypothetical protein